MNDDWNTPKWLMKFFKNYYDPCPNNYIQDAFNVEWHDLTYVNPPYSRGNVIKWIRKALSEANKGKNIIMLLRVDPSTEWYKLLIENNVHIAYFNERLHFDEKESSNFSSMLVFIESKECD